MAPALAAALAAAIPLLPTRDHDFANSLLTAARSKSGLTERQAYWAQKLIDRAATPETPKTVVSVAGIIELISKATDKLKYPKIRLTADNGQRVVLSVAGPKSKYVGSVMVTDGRPFGQNVYFGRISTNGEITESTSMIPEVMALLVKFAADPAGVSAAIGKRFGHCCFCARKLDTTESLAVGYGPNCADKYNLPWG